MSIFTGKVLLITGGTGSFGNAVLRRFLNSDIKEIRIFSRDEKKQDDMRHALQNPKVKSYIGNVRDKSSVDIAMRGVDYVFAAAALKRFRRASSSRWRLHVRMSSVRVTCWNRPLNTVWRTS